MMQPENEFLEGMWEKAGRKEENLKLAEELSRIPRQEGLDSFLWDMFCGIGIRQLYAYMADILLLSFSLAVIFFYIGLKAVGIGSVTAYGVIFAGAPVLYASIFYLSLVKEKQNQTYEQLMSCKYTFFHLMTARMLFNSLLGLVFNMLYAFILAVRYQADVPRLLAAAFASLMIFSLLLVLGIERGRKIAWGAAVSGVWMVGNLLFMGLAANWYPVLLEQIPVVLFVAAGAAAAFIYIRHLLALCGQTFRKEYTNAAN